VGVPPSGPMDSLHHRLANALVGNDPDAAALEFGLTGPSLKFHCDCVVALTGGCVGKGWGGGEPGGQIRVQVGSTKLVLVLIQLVDWGWNNVCARGGENVWS
jgi:allophanate hydrolase subunit 2